MSTAVSALPPFRIEPFFSPRVWGYTDLRPWYDETTGEGQDPIGEAWLTGDQCAILTGPAAGRTLGELFAEDPAILLGPTSYVGSPLLVKIIFAREKLSVQVHPDDAMAQKYGEPRGKTECWYALSADPGASVAAGIKHGVTIQDIERGIKEGTLEQDLEAVPVSTGDMVFVDAGTVHAIWPGAILLETQQNSDSTYRLYDYGRPRELHLEKGLEATKLQTNAGKVAPVEQADRTLLIDQQYFRVERIPVSGVRTAASLRAEDELSAGLSYLFVSKGSAQVAGEGFEPIDLPASRILAVPATSPDWQIESVDDQLELIRITPKGVSL